MSERIDLNEKLDGETFRSYYYLKKELVDFCRENNLPVSGGKVELTDSFRWQEEDKIWQIQRVFIQEREIRKQFI